MRCFTRHHRVDDWHTPAGSPPACPQRGPDVVWFGEMLPKAVLDTARQAAADCGLLSVGTPGLVYPAAELP